MTYKVLLHFKKNLCFFYVSIQRNLNQNRLINECARKNFDVTLYFIKKLYIHNMLAFINSFDKVRIRTKKEILENQVSNIKGPR